MYGKFSMMKMTRGLLSIVGVFCFCGLMSGCIGLDGKENQPVSDNQQNEMHVKVHASKTTDSGMTAKKKHLQDGPNDIRGREPEANVKELTVEKLPRGAKNQRADAAKKRLNQSVELSDRNDLPKAGEKVTLNFDNADLYEVIRTMADVLKINYLVAADVRGSVTIHTAGSIDSKELFTLFFQILELNGLTAVREGDMYKIVAAETVLKMPILARYGRDGSPIPREERMVMQIIPLRYTSAKDIADSITPFLSGSGSVIQTKLNNVLVVIDKNLQLKRILQLVDLFDVDVFDRFNYRFIHLRFTPAEEVTTIVKTLMDPFESEGEKKWEMIPITRQNIIVAVSPNDTILDRIERFISKIDVGGNSTESRIFVYKVKNSDAEELSTLLNKVFAKQNDEDEVKAVTQNALGKRDNKSSTGTTSSDTKKSIEPPPLFPQRQANGNDSADDNRSTAGVGRLKGDLKIVADSTQNVLIISAVPSDYQSILKVLNEIDVLPRQVLINVLVVDLTLTDSLDLGVEWEFSKGGTSDTGLLSGSISGDGMSFVAGLSKEWTSTVSALASKGKAEILSSPSVLASDNESATINVSSQIPIETSSYDSDNGVQTTTVQYHDTGVILTVTPRISDYGMVSMDISQEVSNEADTSSNSDNPSFFSRSVNTILTVGDGQTVVIGGLISEETSDSNSGVPILSSIPLLGALFGSQGNSSTKKELAIFITPHVIKQPDDIKKVSNDFLKSMKDMVKDQRVKELYENRLKP